MATVTVTLTSESLDHLLQIIDAAIDTTPSPIAIKGTFRPLVTALHHMVAITATTPVGTPPPTTGVAPGGGLQINFPRALTPTEQAIVTQLDTMVTACLLSISNVNGTVGYKLVLEV